MSRLLAATVLLLVLLSALSAAAVPPPASAHVPARPAPALDPARQLGIISDALFGALRNLVGFFVVDASAANRFLVLGAVGCDTTQINLDTDCWSASSGGAGGAGIPGSGDAAILDAASGAGIGTIALVAAPAGTCTDFGIVHCFRVNSFVMTGFTGTITVTTSNADLTEWQVNGAFTLGGTLTLPVVASDPYQLTWRVGTGPTDFRVGTFSRGNAINAISVGSGNFFTGEKLFPSLLMSSGATTGNVNADEVSVSGNLGTNAVRARHIIGSSFTMDSISGISSFDWTAATGGTVNLTQWVTYDTTLGLEDYRWVQDASPMGTTVTYVFDCLADNTDYTFERNSVVMATQNAGTPNCFSPQAGRITVPVTGGWGSGDVMTVLSSVLFVPPSGGGGSGLTNFEIDYKTCNDVTLVDKRPEAVNGVLWVWNWGDGSPQDTTSVPEATHHYAVRDLYTIQVTVQDRGGSIQKFVGPIDLTTVQCQVFPIAQVLGPYLLGLLILLVIVLMAQIALDRTNKYTRWLLIAFFAVVAIIIVFIYYGWSPVLPGGVQF